jgi:RNA polymerase sigma factor (sigma-70 family)
VDNSINDVWQGILNKDPACWEQFVQRLNPLVYTVLTRSGLGEDEIEDCAQQTWLALYKSRVQIKDPNRVPVWLIRVASREAARLIRAKASSRSTDPQASGILPASPPDEELELIEAAAMLEQGLTLLDAKCRRLLHSIFLAPEKMSYRGIAKELGIPPNSLGPTRSRCLRKLRKILEKLGYRRVL